jgi:translation initiation factor IF-2
LQNQFAGDKGNKEASKGVSEEIKKEKEATSS